MQTITKLKEPKITITNNMLRIDGVLINTCNDLDYNVKTRFDIIDDLIEWIAECRNSDADAMRDDLEMLMCSDAIWVLSSTLTNEYLTFEDDAEDFVAECEKLKKRGI